MYGSPGGILLGLLAMVARRRISDQLRPAVRCARTTVIQMQSACTDIRVESTVATTLITETIALAADPRTSLSLNAEHATDQRARARRICVLRICVLRICALRI